MPSGKRFPRTRDDAVVDLADSPRIICGALPTPGGPSASSSEAILFPVRLCSESFTDPQ